MRNNILLAITMILTIAFLFSLLVNQSILDSTTFIIKKVTVTGVGKDTLYEYGIDNGDYFVITTNKKLGNINDTLVLSTKH